MTRDTHKLQSIERGIVEISPRRAGRGIRSFKDPTIIHRVNSHRIRQRIYEQSMCVGVQTRFIRTEV